MVTLKDVAAKAGVSLTTVSRVLNKRGYLSEKTCQKVYDAMKELNYHPNELARSLITRKSSVLGVIVPSIRHPFFAELIHWLEFHIEKNGYRMMLCNSLQSKQKEIGYIDMLNSNKVAGIIICTRSSDMDRHLQVGFPVISIERSISNAIPSVVCDNYQGGELATRHLVEAGCRSLAILGGSDDVRLPADQRCESFLAVCAEQGVRAEVFPTKESDFVNRRYAGTIRRMLEQYPQMDGLFATSDVMAAQVLQVCREQGRRVPESLKVVGFDGIELSTWTTPRLTTVRQPVEEMSAYAVDTILRQIAGEVVPIKTILPVSLVARETTGAESVLQYEDVEREVAST